MHDHDAFKIRCTPHMHVICCMPLLPFSSIIPIELQNGQTAACKHCRCHSITAHATAKLPKAAHACIKSNSL